MSFIRKILCAIAALSIVLYSCQPQVKDNNYTAEEIQQETEKANRFFDQVFDEYVDRHPMDQSYLGIKKDQDKWNDISDEHREKEIEILKANLIKLKEIDFNKLDEQAKLSYRLFEYDGQREIENFKWRYHDYPVNQMFGLHSDIPGFLINIHQITDTTDALAYISRIEKTGPLFDQLIKNIEVRADKGIIPPKFVFEKVLDDCKNVLKGAPFEKSNQKNTLWEDFSAKVNALELDASVKNELLYKAEAALTNHFLPAYNKLINYLKDLEKKATTDDGVWKFPDGNKFYESALQKTTTTNMTPDEVYDLGISEVERIHNEMRGIMKQVNFPSDDLQEFFKFMREDKQFYYSNDSSGKKAYLAKANAIIDSMRAKLDDLFITKPKAALVVKAVEPFREKSTAGAFYQPPAPDGSRPGTYYANLYDMGAMPTYEMEALAYHEAIPGHHMQLSIAQELENIPKFRKFGFYTAYIEGWGLYSELTPKEMGFYKDPYSDFGRLSMELLRACRLVVDVGIHYKKWTRQQATEYLMQNTPNNEVDCVREIDRYIVMPSQATAYKVGMYKILQLREMAKERLKEKFDIREFHETVLKYGALPLDILEENVEKWINSKK
ncbi:MAG TPA: DUF885 domain-containing protein [Cytophagaceae bacterium]